ESHQQDRGCNRRQIQDAAQPFPTLSFGIVEDLAAHEITFRGSKTRLQREVHAANRRALSLSELYLYDANQCDVLISPLPSCCSPWRWASGYASGFCGISRR